MKRMNEKPTERRLAFFAAVSIALIIPLWTIFSRVFVIGAADGRGNSISYYTFIVFGWLSLFGLLYFVIPLLKFMNLRVKPLYLFIILAFIIALMIYFAGIILLPYTATLIIEIVLVINITANYRRNDGVDESDGS